MLFTVLKNTAGYCLLVHTVHYLTLDLNNIFVNIETKINKCCNETLL